MIFFLYAISFSEAICVNTTNIKHTSERPIRTSSLPFCSEHSSRTCCDTSSSLNIYKRFYRTIQDPPVYDNYEGYSSNCMANLQKALCYECDGDIGEGLIEGICKDFCNAWFKSCEEDYFVANGKEIEFCNGASLICFKLKEITTNSNAFCEKMGIKPRSSNCFTGVPSSIKKGPAPKELPKSSFSSMIPYIILGASSLLTITLSVIYYKNFIKKPVDIREIRIKKFSQ